MGDWLAKHKILFPFIVTSSLRATQYSSWNYGSHRRKSTNSPTGSRNLKSWGAVRVRTHYINMRCSQHAVCAEAPQLRQWPKYEQCPQSCRTQLLTLEHRAGQKYPVSICHPGLIHTSLCKGQLLSRLDEHSKSPGQGVGGGDRTLQRQSVPWREAPFHQCCARLSHSVLSCA